MLPGPVVAVDDPDRALGNPRGQGVVGRVEGGEVLHRRRVRLAVPALELARDEVAGPGQVVEPHLAGLHRVQGGEDVDRRGADDRARLLRHLLAGLGVVEDLPGREVHDVEVGAPDVVVVAERARRRDGDVRRVERGEEPPLAAHVVGRLQHPAQRRPPQRPRVPGLVGDAVGQVGAPAGDAGELERALDLVDVVAEPAHDDVGDLLGAHDAPPGRSTILPTWVLDSR